METPRTDIAVCRSVLSWTNLIPPPPPANCLRDLVSRSCNCGHQQRMADRSMSYITFAALALCILSSVGLVARSFLPLLRDRSSRQPFLQLFHPKGLGFSAAEFLRRACFHPTAKQQQAARSVLALRNVSADCERGGTSPSLGPAGLARCPVVLRATATVNNHLLHLPPPP